MPELPASVPALRVGRLFDLALTFVIAASGATLVSAALGQESLIIDMAVTGAWVPWVLAAAGIGLLLDSGRSVALWWSGVGRLPRTLETALSHRHATRIRGFARLTLGAILLVVLGPGQSIGAVTISRGAWALWLLAGFVTLLGGLGVWFGSERTLRTLRLESGHGVRGRGIIQNVHDTGWRINDDPRVRLDLTVSIPDDDPYQTVVTETVPLILLARLEKGRSLPVFVDPQARDHLIILWDEE